MLDHLAALFTLVGDDLRTIAVEKAVDALFDTNQEVVRRLDRIESKLDVLIDKDAAAGWQYLTQAQEPHRSPAEQNEQVARALDAFVNAAASAADDPMARSIARVYQAVCWSCLGSRADVLRRLGEATTDAYDAVYQAAVQFNEPQRTAEAMRESWRRRHLPGWEVTDRRLANRADSISWPERVWHGGPTSSSRQIQNRLEPHLDQVNLWSRSVTELYEQMRTQRPPRPGPAKRYCEVSRYGEPGKPGRARVTMYPVLATSIDVRGIVVSFLEAVPTVVDNVEYVDVRLHLDLSAHVARERAPYRSKSWYVADYAPDRVDAATRFLDGDGLPPHQNRVIHQTRVPDERAWLRAGPSQWGGGLKMGPGSRTEASGWRRFLRRNYVTVLTVEPAGLIWFQPDRRGPRPGIDVRINLGDYRLTDRAATVDS